MVYLYLPFFPLVSFCLFLCKTGLGFCHLEGKVETRSPHPNVLVIVPYIVSPATSKPLRDKRGSAVRSCCLSALHPNCRTGSDPVHRIYGRE